MKRTIKSIWLAAGLVMTFTAAFAATASASVTTNEATNIVPATATLNGTANPEGKEYLCMFDWGTTTSYGSVKVAAVVKGSSPTPVSTQISGLAADTTYHFRMRCLSGGSTINGEDRTFTTPPWPEVATEAATNLHGTEATLNGNVDPNGEATSYWFEYGTTTSYGSKIPIAGKEVGSGTSQVTVSQVPTGLSRNTTYHFRIAAQNAGGTAYGADKTFTTINLPKAITEAAGEVTTSSAGLNGTLNPETLATKYWFEYGTTTSYGKFTSTLEKTGSSDVAVGAKAIFLAPNTTYHFRLVAKNSVGTTYGADQQFYTGPPKVTTGEATGVTATEATLNATVNVGGNSATCLFGWGPTASYGSYAWYGTVNGTSDTPISVIATGLSPNTTYHFGVACSNALGFIEGEDRTFKTAP